jgi:integrase
MVTQKRGIRGRGSLYSVSVNGRTVWKAAKSITVTEEATGQKKRKRITGTGSTAQEAVQRLEKRLYERAGGLKPSTQEENEHRHRFGDWFYEWLDSLTAKRVSDIVKHGYKRRGEMYLLPYLADEVVEEMKPQTLEKLFETTLPALTNKDGSRLLSDATLLNIYRVLQMCLTKAVKDPRFSITTSPLSSIPAPRPEREPESLGAVTGMTKGLIKWMVEHNHPDYTRFLFQWIGLRRSERLGLSWSNVRNLSNEKATIRVSQQLARYQNGGGYYLKPPKTKTSVRVIPLGEPFLSALRDWKKQQDKWKLSEDWNPDPQFADLVFLRPNGKIITQNEDNEDWHKLLTDYMGKDAPHWRGHLNRHITATILAEKNVPPHAAMKILGHASEAMNRYYTSITVKALEDPISSLGEALTERTNNKKEG